MGTTDSRRGLLERVDELAAIDALVASSALGDGRLLVFEGPPGIGKTSLLGAATRHADRAGFIVARACGRELEQDFPFGVVLQLFEPVMRAQTPRERERLLSGAAALARPLLLPGAEGNPLPGADARFSIVHGLFWLVAELAERTPVLLAVDDAQWVDASSLRFLHYLAVRIADLRVAIAAATRPTSAQRPGVRRLLDLPGSRLVQPQPLSEAGVTNMLGIEDGDDTFRRACHELTGGNPLLVQELLTNLLVVNDRAPSIDPVDAVLPTVARRVGRLPQPAQQLAHAAAVLGEGGSLGDAARMVGLATNEARAAAAGLVESALLRESDPIAFVHPLVRTSVIESIDRDARAALHAQAARLLDDQGAPAELVAAHLAEAEPSGSARAVEVLRSAASRALTAGTAPSAVRWLRRAAAETTESPDVDASLLFDLANAEAAAGEPVWQRHLDQAVAATGDAVASAEQLYRLARTLHSSGRLDLAAQVCKDGLDMLGERDTELALRLLGGFAAAARIDLDAREKALELIDATLDGRELGNSRAELALLSHLAYERAIRGGPEGEATAAEVRDLAVRALAIDEAIDEAPDPLAFYPAVLALQWCDAYDEVEAALEVAFKWARRTGNVVAFATASNYRAPIRLGQCRIAEAAADAEAGLEGFNHGWRLAVPGAAGNLALARLERGDLDGAEAALELPGGTEPWTGGAPFTFFLYAQGEVLLAQDHVGRAVETLLECGRRQTRMRAENPSVMPWRSSAATALARAGDDVQARALVLEELDLAGRFGSRRAVARALRVDALLGPPDELVGRLEAAVAQVSDSPAAYELATSLIELGAALRRRGDRTAAREPLRRGLDIAERGGALEMAGRARAELAAAGAKPRRAALTGPDSLTPSERRVAELAASGRRNREIAEELFVSVKAVEFHLGNAFRKLSIASRDDLATALAPAS